MQNTPRISRTRSVPSIRYSFVRILWIFTIHSSFRDATCGRSSKLPSIDLKEVYLTFSSVIQQHVASGIWYKISPPSTTFAIETTRNVQLLNYCELQKSQEKVIALTSVSIDKRTISCYLLQGMIDSMISDYRSSIQAIINVYGWIFFSS